MRRTQYHVCRVFLIVIYFLLGGKHQENVGKKMSDQLETIQTQTLTKSHFIKSFQLPKSFLQTMYLNFMLIKFQTSSIIPLRIYFHLNKKILIETD